MISRWPLWTVPFRKWLSLYLLATEIQTSISSSTPETVRNFASPVLTSDVSKSNLYKHCDKVLQANHDACNIGTVPSSDHNDWKSASFGRDSITIRPSDPKFCTASQVVLFSSRKSGSSVTLSCQEGCEIDDCSLISYLLRQHFFFNICLFR